MLNTLNNKTDGDFLLELAMAVMGRFVGSPTKTAVLTSGLMGLQI